MMFDKTQIPIFSTIVGKKLRELREAGRVSQETLSTLLDISRPTLMAYETGKQSISVAEAYLAADFFQVEISALLPTLEEMKRITSLDNVIAEKGVNGETLKDIQAFVSQIKGDKK